MPRSPLATVVLAAALVLAGCGGGGDSGTAKELLDDAFTRPIGSALVSADLDLELDGLEGVEDPIRIRLEGPYRSGGGERIPAFDWQISFAGGGVTIAAGLLSTSENVFVNFQGTDYELGERRIARFNRRLARLDRQPDRSLSDFGIDARDWVADARGEGDDDVAGVETAHVSARLDVGRMLADLNRLVARTGSPSAQLTKRQRDKIERVIEDPRLDVYVGKDDGAVHRLSADLELDVPKEDRAGVRGIEGGSISFSVEFAEIGRPHRIDAPESARPLSELAGQLGGLGALSGGSGTPESRQLDEYSRCLDDADPSHLDGIQRCSELLD
jgi:hypothetical protein